MKTIYKIIMTGILCMLIAPLSLSAQNNGKEMNVSPFNELEIKQVGNVYLIQGDKESVRLKNGEEISDKLKIENSGKKLIISTTEDVYVTYCHLSSLYIKAAGNIKTNNTMKGSDLSVKIVAVGNVTMNIQSSKLITDFTGTGNIKLTGNAQEFSLNCSGTGNINTGEFKSSVLLLNLKGVGNVTVYADKEISIDASGTGNITYKGHPELKHLSKHATGNITEE
jgi:hypothetical protein